MIVEYLAAFLHGAEEDLRVTSGRQVIGNFFPDNIMSRRSLCPPAVTDNKEIAIADPGFQQNAGERSLEGSQ